MEYAPKESDHSHKRFYRFRHSIATFELIRFHYIGCVLCFQRRDSLSPQKGSFFLLRNESSCCYHVNVELKWFFFSHFNSSKSPDQKFVVQMTREFFWHFQFRRNLFFECWKSTCISKVLALIALLCAQTFDRRQLCAVSPVELFHFV